MSSFSTHLTLPYWSFHQHAHEKAPSLLNENCLEQWLYLPAPGWLLAFPNHGMLDVYTCLKVTYQSNSNISVCSCQFNIYYFSKWRTCHGLLPTHPLCSFTLLVVQYKLSWLGQSSHYCQTHHGVHFWCQISSTLSLPHTVLPMLKGPGSWDFPGVLFSCTVISISHLLYKWSLSWVKILYYHTQHTKPSSNNSSCRPKILISPSKKYNKMKGLSLIR